MDLRGQVEALEAGVGAADLVGWRVFEVSGEDARGWLHDLLTADIEPLTVGEAARALLLTPTGRIRADVLVAAHGDGFVLLQHPEQPEPIDALLAPYVLSSQVALDDRSGEVRAFAFPGGAPDELPGGARRHRPSALGPGEDVLVARDADPAVGLPTAGPEAADAWRVTQGAARFPVDLTPSSLPHEAGLEALMDPDKGCFLGQEAIAKVRNLGHPPFVVLAADGPAEAGDAVVAGDRDAGEVTSAWDGHAILRVRWAMRDADLATFRGGRLRVRGLASGAP